MFSKSQKIEPPKTLSMQEIQEDLETFQRTERIINKTMIIDDLQARQDDEMNLNEWWDAWDVTKMQINQLESEQRRIDDIKADLQTQKESIQQTRQTLIDEIANTLENIHSTNVKN